VTKRFLIVGQGLAGSILTEHLLAAGQDVLVVNQPNPNAASRVAAGMYHPMIFRKLGLSWKAKLTAPYSKQFYASLEEKLQIKFDQKINLTRFRGTEFEAEQWKLRMLDFGMDTILSEEVDSEIEGRGFNAPNGYGQVDGGGWLDTNVFIDAYAAFLKSKNALLEVPFDHNDLEQTTSGWKWDDKAFDHVIFCEGIGLHENPFFNYLPLVGTKGEIITIRSKELNVSSILNAGFFVLPIGDDCYRVGATFDHKDKSDDCTDEARDQLLAKLDGLITVAYEVVGQRAGIRPTVTDRRPLIGQHSIGKRLWVFNGFGTKAVALAPYFADMTVNHILFDGVLDEEVDIVRHDKRLKK